MPRPKTYKTQPRTPRRQKRPTHEFPLIGSLIRLPKPTPAGIESFKQLFIDHFKMELSDEDASYYATKTLQLAYVLQPPEERHLVLTKEEIEHLVQTGVFPSDM